jgi:hypothetical protein
MREGGMMSDFKEMKVESVLWCAEIPNVIIVCMPDKW